MKTILALSFLAIAGFALVYTGWGQTEISKFTQCTQDADCFLARTCVGCNQCFSKSPLINGIDCAAFCAPDYTLECKCAQGQCSAEKKGTQELIESLNDEKIGIQMKYFIVQTLGETEDARAIEPLIRSLDNRDDSFRALVSDALKNITGEPFGQDQARWQQWWEQNKEKLLDESPQE
jgi:hypothetical protein